MGHVESQNANIHTVCPSHGILAGKSRDKRGNAVTNEEIVQTYWDHFEVLAFHAVKSELPQDFIIEETITQSIKDGGYDGEFILLSQDRTTFQILFEAKLRSNTKGALPLNDFAKALVIAIVRQADMIYIVTNLHFSSETMKLLERYAYSASLNIQLLNGASIREFIETHRTLLRDIHMDLQNFLISQNRVLEAQTLPFSVPEEFTASAGSAPCLEEKYRIQARNFRRKSDVLCVEGHIGCGKSYYIENLCCALTLEKKQVCIIDLSKCQTYKDLFLKVMEETLGLSLELVDLVNTQSFVQAFSRIGSSLSSEDDIRMLKFIFSRETEYPYDYSILFAQITSFYARLCLPRRTRNIVVAFLNLAYAQREVLQLLLYFLEKRVMFSSILEITLNSLDCVVSEDWRSVCAKLIRLSTLEPYCVEDWQPDDAKKFLREHIAGISENQVDSLILRFGCTPAELSRLVEVISYSDIYEGTPKELVFQEIAALKITRNDSLYRTCYEYMQYANSDSLYVYAFILLLSGEVSRSALDEFFKDQQRTVKIISLVQKSSLFIVDGRTVAVRNARAEECLQAYCEGVLSLCVVEDVAHFIESRMERFHLTMEASMELTCKVNYYRAPETYAESLAELGGHYLKLGQTPLARLQYEKAYTVMKKSSQICLSPLVVLQIRLGLVETLIWEIGAANEKLQDQLNFIASFSLPKLDQDLTYKCLMLRYYCLRYQYHHAQDQHTQALDFAKEGVEWAETHNLYQVAPENCGRIWRFYAIAVKEMTQDIKKCLDVFQKGAEKCQDSVQFLFGYTIHKNMAVDDADAQKRISKKLENYGPLLKREKELSIDEYLHYRVNVAALHFLAKDYEEALKQYQPLLEKSAIFNIVREEIRILNDMANLCWIRGESGEAYKKYRKGRALAKISGCVGNYWPILINLMSFELSKGRYSHALKLYQELEPILKQNGSHLRTEGLSFEQREYYTAALYICLKNLLTLHQVYSNCQLLSAAGQLLKISGIRVPGRNRQSADMESIIRQLPLDGTIFDHNGLYLLKD